VVMIYASSDREPILGGLLGQVHRGPLKMAQAVAVKVQRRAALSRSAQLPLLVRNIAKLVSRNVSLIAATGRPDRRARPCGFRGDGLSPRSGECRSFAQASPQAQSPHAVPALTRRPPPAGLLRWNGLMGSSSQPIEQSKPSAIDAR